MPLPSLFPALLIAALSSPADVAVAPGGTGHAPATVGSRAASAAHSRMQSHPDMTASLAAIVDPRGVRAPEVLIDGPGSARPGDIVILDASRSSSFTRKRPAFSWQAPGRITLSVDHTGGAQRAFFVAPEVKMETRIAIALEINDGVSTGTRVHIVTVRPAGANAAD